MAVFNKSIQSRFEARVAECISDFGWTPIQNIENSRMYSPDTGSVQRFFEPHIIVRDKGLQLSGRIGIYLPDFEVYWQSINNEYDKVHIPFGMIISNCSSLMSYPYFLYAEDNELHGWINLILKEASALPKKLEQLSFDLSLNKIGNYHTKYYFMTNSKSECAIKWVLDVTA